MASGYRQLNVWERSMDLVVQAYEIAKQFPDSERFGLVSQLQRAAVSVPANIAEGHGRTHLGDYLHHLSIAHGSLMELETHVEIAARLKYVAAHEVQTILSETAQIGRMLNGLIRSIQAKKTGRSHQRSGVREDEPEFETHSDP